MSAQGNINIQLKSTKRQQQATIKVKESKEFMDVMTDITDLVFNKSTEMSDGLYLELSNKILELYNLELMSDIQIQSAKRLVNQSKHRYTPEQKRKALENGSPYLKMCDNCGIVISKKNNDHYNNGKCKDTSILVSVISDAELEENHNSKMVCKYIGGGSDGVNQSS